MAFGHPLTLWLPVVSVAQADAEGVRPQHWPSVSVGTGVRRFCRGEVLRCDPARAMGINEKFIIADVMIIHDVVERFKRETE